MSLRFLYTLDDFEYAGERIPIMVHHDNESGSNPLYRIEFEYKKCRVVDWYYHDDIADAYSLTRTYCFIIDKLGLPGTEHFKECKERLARMKKGFILIDDKVFKFDKTSLFISPHKIHLMQIKMADGTLIDGDSIMNHDIYIKEKDSYSYEKTLYNLRTNVENYYKFKKILPADEYFLEDKTKEYSQLLLEYQTLLS